MKASHSIKNGIGKLTRSFYPRKMKLASYDLLVIGGGITGLGIARKAATKGLSVLLIEKNELGSGTSGHFHELIHSGVRYAVSDPPGARECFEENQALLSPQSLVREAITQTGGLFVALTDSDIAYSEELIAACHKINIPIADVAIDKILSREPRINRSVKRALYVPDSFIDGKKAIKINKNIAKDYGADLLTHHTVIGFEKTGNKIQSLVIKNRDQEMSLISCGFVINAAGPWAGQVGKLAGVEIALIPYRGVLLVFKEQLSTHVINRCHKPSDGDIFVPARSHTIFGTTSKGVEDVSDFSIQKDEVEHLLTEGEKMFPGLSARTIVNQYAGFRPLYASVKDNTNGRELSRSFTIINHKENGINNFISVVGGKFMLYERMGDMALEVMQHNIQISHKKFDSVKTNEYEHEVASGGRFID